jgi:hypothetical protein
MQADDLLSLPSRRVRRRVVTGLTDWIAQKDSLLAFIKKEREVPTDIIRIIDKFLVCPHNYKCHLTSTGSCCRCADRRTKYNQYVDGKGNQKTNNHAAYYCPGCR